MFIKIPFESTIDFKTNISEVTKMSLEHDFNVSGGVVLGNFYISGEYKAHEVSVNKEPFKYTLPFTVEISDRIKEDTLEFNIEDFSYDIVDHKALKVNIEYSLSADEKEEEELFTRVDESELESELAFIDNFLDNNEKEETSKESVKVVEEPSEELTKPTYTLTIEDNSEREDAAAKKEEAKEDEKEAESTETKERLTAEEEKTIMETIKSSDDTFVTYHVHIVKENETIESISALYSVPTTLISEYNTIDNLNTGDKILIPKCDE